MAGELLIFDAAASNIDGTDPGTALNVGPGTNYALREFDAPAPSQTVQWAASVDTEGSLPASRKHENRLISVTVLCSTAAALRSLEAKIGKIAREGGTLKWVLPNAETVIFDLHSADTFAPRIDKLLYVRAGAFCEVQMTLPALPYGRGASVTLSDHAETTSPVLVFTETGIKGNWFGVGELIVDNDDGVAQQQVLLWGIQSKEYDSASTAALFFEAESLSVSTGVADPGPAGASGGGANKTVKQTNSGTAIATTTLTSAGEFRLYARVRVPATNTGTVSVRAIYHRSGDIPNITNDYVTIDPAQEGNWLLIDLGQINVPRAAKGTHGWTLTTQESMTVGTDVVYYDWFMLLPVSECSGIISGDGQSVAGVPLSAAIRGDSVLVGSSSTWGRPQSYEGDYLRIPPAGAESRTLRVIAKFSRGRIYVSGSSSTSGAAFDSSTDDLSARLTYVPRYLVVPEP